MIDRGTGPGLIYGERLKYVATAIEKTDKDQDNLPANEQREVFLGPNSRCSDADPDLFFPEKGGTTQAAKVICFNCVVIYDCLGSAIKAREQFGVRGGLSTTEQKRLFKIHNESGDIAAIAAAEEIWRKDSARFGVEVVSLAK